MMKTENIYENINQRKLCSEIKRKTSVLYISVKKSYRN